MVKIPEHIQMTTPDEWDNLADKVLLAAIWMDVAWLRPKDWDRAHKS